MGVVWPSGCIPLRPRFARSRPLSFRKGTFVGAFNWRGVIHPLPNPLPIEGEGIIDVRSIAASGFRAGDNSHALPRLVGGFCVQHRRRRQTVGPPGSIV